MKVPAASPAFWAVAMGSKSAYEQPVGSFSACLSCQRLCRGLLGSAATAASGPLT